VRRGALIAGIVLTLGGLAPAAPPARPAPPPPAPAPARSPAASPSPSPPSPSPPSPSPSPSPDSYSNGKTISGRKSDFHLALTFDDGPDYKNTPSILDTLDQYGIKATFFVVGSRFGGKSEVAKKNRAVLADIVRRGHLVGNHTWKHFPLPTLKDPKLSFEVDRNAEIIKGVTGVYPWFFRPPYGSMSKRIAKELARRKITNVLWSSDSDDTNKPFKTEKVHRKSIAAILKNNGGVHLMHDPHRWSASALPLVLADLQAENCRRLAAGERIIEVVNLDYFYVPREGEAPATPPEAVAARAAWRKQLDSACQARAAAAKPAPPAGSGGGAAEKPASSRSD